MIKDLMCLRKQMILFAYAVTGVLVLSVMFVLSARFGNIAAANRMMMAENNLSEIDITNMSTTALILFMLIPIAMVGDVTTIFKMDGKAGFSGVSSILPLSIGQRVMARYLTVFMMFGIGVTVDTLISFVLSKLTDIISFAEFFGIIISGASLMTVYGSLVILFCFLLGYGKEDYAIIASCAVILIGTIFPNIKKLKSVFLSVSADNSDSIDFISGFMDFIKYKYFILLIIAAAVTAVSYFISVGIVTRKRGTV